MIITVELKDDVLAALLTRSLETSRSVEVLLDEILREAFEHPPADSIEVDQIVNESLAAVRDWPSDEFILEDVVSAESWTALSTGDRKSFGKRFRKKAEASKIAEWVRRTSGNKAVYRKL